MWYKQISRIHKDISPVHVCPEKWGQGKVVCVANIYAYLIIPGCICHIQILQYKINQRVTWLFMYCLNSIMFCLWERILYSFNKKFLIVYHFSFLIVYFTLSPLSPKMFTFFIWVNPCDRKGLTVPVSYKKPSVLVTVKSSKIIIT